MRYLHLAFYDYVYFLKISQIMFTTNNSLLIQNANYLKQIQSISNI